MWILRTTDRSEAGPLTFRLMPGAMKTMGRSTTADFVLDAGMVSRFHCRLTVAPDGTVEIEDLGSTNGTFVNDQRVDTKGPLKEGDRLRVGRVELTMTKAPAAGEGAADRGQSEQEPDARGLKPAGPAESVD